MICLACGECCRTMSPFFEGRPCRFLVMDGDVATCLIYEARPTVCCLHDFPASVCPIGMQILELETDSSVRQRVAKVKEVHGEECPLFTRETTKPECKGGGRYICLLCGRKKSPFEKA